MNSFLQPQRQEGDSLEAQAPSTEAIDDVRTRARWSRVDLGGAPGTACQRFKFGERPLPDRRRFQPQPRAGTQSAAPARARRPTSTPLGGA